jgi:hypothetical protein
MGGRELTRVMDLEQLDESVVARLIQVFTVYTTGFRPWLQDMSSFIYIIILSPF